MIHELRDWFWLRVHKFSGTTVLENSIILFLCAIMLCNPFHELIKLHLIPRLFYCAYIILPEMLLQYLIPLMFRNLLLISSRSLFTSSYMLLFLHQYSSSVQIIFILPPPSLSLLCINRKQMYCLSASILQRQKSKSKFPL